MLNSFSLKNISTFAVVVLLGVGSVMAQSDVPADTTTTASDSTEYFDQNSIIPVISVNADVLESETQSQDVSGLLQSSRDPYISVAGFNFSGARFRVRGYGSENFDVMMNGVRMNDPESGWAIWANWGGLNDITRYQEITTGLDASQLTFGGLGGSSNIQIRASKIRKGTKASYALSNRSYDHRLIVTKSTGMMANGWAFALSGSIRYANQGYVEGTFYNAASYFASIEKKINDKHSIGLVGFGAPTIQGRQGISVQEAYDLTGSNYYNPYWGYQTDAATGNQVKRNAKERRNHKPMLFLSHYFDINSNSKLTSSVYYQYGKAGNTGLNWYNAQDPRPSYYKYLPSYFIDRGELGNADALSEEWQSGNVGQIDWDQLYFANSKNLYLVKDDNGNVINASDEVNRSKYIVEEFRQDPRLLGFNTHYFNSLSDKLKLSAALNASAYKSKNFKVMDDLLGGDFWIDINQFAERDIDAEGGEQNNLEDPDKLIKVGDVFGYNYDINVHKVNGFVQAEYVLSKVEMYGALSLGRTSFWRNGYWQNGQFPENSKGESERQTFFNYGVKAGLTYKLNGRHYVTAHGALMTRPPSVRNSFVSPRTRNVVVDGLTNETLYSGDINYIIKHPRFKVRATYFYTEVKNQTWSRSFYHDEFRNFVNYNMTGVDNLYTGAELGFDVKATQTVSISGAVTKADYIYNSRPTATVTVDNSSELLAENRTVYLENYRVGGMPQTAASLGVKYSSPKYWFAGANFNYFADIYMEANPDRRTEEALDKYVTSDPQWNEVIGQTKLNNGYTVNAFAGKSWRLKYKYFINITANVSNILNNKEFTTGGFEQLRYDSNQISKFPNKLGYMYGRTYFVMVSFRF
ncbi:TonB-dependent receptor plug domain-containing protein [Flavobacteriales bacterium]|nr:TonB-dependent receptor plug domain-containing protein [Flavobacteriales bacterium]